MNLECISKGNVLSEEERQYRLKMFNRFKNEGLIDKEFIPYLNIINSFPFICTTQCCTGHYENEKKGRKAHIDFRCKLTPNKVVDCIIRPVQENYPTVYFTLMTENNRLRYVLWLDNDNWKEEIEYLIKLLNQINNAK